jgi:DNA-binding protein YbaB
MTVTAAVFWRIVVAISVFGVIGQSDATASGFLRFFTADTWECKEAGEPPPRVAYVPKAGGLTIFVHGPHQVSFFDIACMPAAGSYHGCEYQKGWGSVTVEVSGDAAPVKLSFDRSSVSYTFLEEALGNAVIAAFRKGKGARITITRPDRSVMYTQNVKLEGFGAALDQCLVRWAV